MHQQHQTRISSGFTLLEMLAATAMVAVIATALMGALRTAFIAQASGERMVARSRALSAMASIVRRDLQSTLPLTGILAGPLIGLDGGSGDSLHDSVRFSTASGIELISYDGLDYSMLGASSFSATPIGHRAGCDVQEVELTLAGDPGSDQGATLVRYVRRNLLAELEPPVQAVTLLRGVRGLQIRYFDGSDWLDTWDSGAVENAAPAAVAMVIETDGSAPMRLVVALPAAAASQEGAVIR